MDEQERRQADEPMSGWFYLSFADYLFRGACIVKARDFVEAVTASQKMQINPGGQVAGLEVPERYLPEERFRNRLLMMEEIKSFWPDAKSLKEHREFVESGGD